MPPSFVGLALTDIPGHRSSANPADPDPPVPSLVSPVVTPDISVARLTDQEGSSAPSP